MARILTSFLTLALLVGCATPLHVKVDSQITKGDSQEKVRDVLGDPDSFGPSRTVSGGTDWTYHASGSVCSLSFENGLVSQIACDSSNYVSTGRKFLRGFGAAMQGAGDGIANSNKNRFHCKPDLLGGYNCN